MTADEAPAFRVARGNPTDEEVAAVLTALVAASRVPEPRPEVDSREVGGWSAYYRVMRAPIRYGRNAWRASVR